MSKITEPTPEAAMMLLQQRNRSRAVEVGIMGLGYVGLAEAMALAKAGRRVTGFDLDSIRSHNCHEP
ncbi:MAG TPA: hypothetical protein VNP04_10485 [Alphaproteobacteria bacterium]|nr:hypothetical protein [Alphaproteobacteria bacterium]